MCGIAGAININTLKPLSAPDLIPMIHCLHHRGPDEWGYYINQSASVMFAHTRLAIVDLKTGRQPLTNENKTLWLACNGEIYQFESLRKDLEKAGHQFKTQSDSEVIVHLYETYGEQFFKYLRGEFAFVLYDARQGISYLVRDRFGIKPLFYTISNGVLCFASEIKSLLRYPGVLAELNHEYAYHLMHGILMPGETTFKNIFQVKPGCFLKVKQNELNEHPYWELPLEQPIETPSISDEAYVEEFAHLFDESVRIRLQGDVEVGAYLSGGVDSIATAKTMYKVKNNPITTFTIGFNHPQYDESNAVQDMNTHHFRKHFIHIEQQALAPHFIKSLWHSEIPVLNTHGTAKFLLSSFAHQKLKVVLTGEGADELLLGYNQFKHLQLLEHLKHHPKDKAAAKLLHKFHREQGMLSGIMKSRKLPHYKATSALFGAYPYIALRKHLLQRRLRHLLSKPFLAAHQHLDSLNILSDALAHPPNHNYSSLALTQSTIIKTDLCNYILNYLGDRQEMAHAIEGRTPFLDHHLVEFLAKLPLSMKLNAEHDKYILRKSMLNDVPTALNIPKKIFFAPTLDTLGFNQQSTLFDSYLSNENIKEVGIFDVHAINILKKLIQLLPKQTELYLLCEMLFTTVLSLHIIHDLFCKNLEHSVSRFTNSQLNYDLVANRIQ